jgi:hypothetical protein
MFRPSSQSAGMIKLAIDEEVERLRAAGTKGIQRIRVGDKDYSIDLDTYQTSAAVCEWLDNAACLPPVTSFGFRMGSLVSAPHPAPDPR